MRARIAKSTTTCIWIPNGLNDKYVVSICDPLCDILASRLKPATKAGCEDCQTVAAQIAADAAALTEDKE